MSVDVATPSATNVVGLAVIVDTVADTAPTVKVTVTVLDKARLSVASVAEMVLVSTNVDFIIAVV